MRKNLIAATLAFSIAACGSNGSESAPVEGEQPDQQSADASQEGQLDGNEFNPQDGEDVGLAMDMRLFPGAEIVSQDGNVITFTSGEARPQVIDWYFRKLDARGFDIPAPGMSGFTASSDEGSVELVAGDGEYVLTVSPAS